MKEIKYSITDRSTIFTPFERLSMGMNFMLRIAHLQRMKNIEINIDEEKITIEGTRTIKAGDLHLDIKREDFRGSSVNFRAFNLIGIILGSILALGGLSLVLVYATGLSGGSGDEPFLFVGLLVLVIGALIIVLSCLKKTTITLRFVDKNSNSVRHFAIKVRRNSKDYYQTAIEFTEKLWSK